MTLHYLPTRVAVHDIGMKKALENSGRESSTNKSGWFHSLDLWYCREAQAHRWRRREFPQAGILCIPCAIVHGVDLLEGFL
jgi:hypothetical protein